ncbi:MAG: hypothetical protein ACE5G0_19150, partial [Rhodothermales bacterium]
MRVLSLRRRFPVRRGEAPSAYLLLLPVLAFFLVFQYYPILKSVAISFMEYGLLMRETPWI